MHNRNLAKEKNTKHITKHQQNELSDEIALRDEIFQLKRQMMLLKKANERHVVKVRKYEDEAKKKDRQIEQLMDPVKNGDVRKLLSSKGAALLLNLKEQNNTLIQMILDKDAQIRRLMAEIKTSKLYGSSRRSDSYRIEIDRLRNLLIKSQNMVKVAQDVSQRRSICVGGTPNMELTTSSDQSTPRDLEELQFTIQSLENHMKYSNELLARKNEQILCLTDQLNAAVNANQCNTCRRKYESKCYGTVKDSPVQTELFNCSELDVDVPNAFESPSSCRASTEPKVFDRSITSKCGRQPERSRHSNSAPSASEKMKDSMPWDIGWKENEDARQCCTEQICKEYVKQEDRISSDEKFSPEKLKGLRQIAFEDSLEEKESDTHRSGELQVSFKKSEDSDIETAEFEMMEMRIETGQIEIEESTVQSDNEADASKTSRSLKSDDDQSKQLAEDAQNDEDLLQNENSFQGTSGSALQRIIFPPGEPFTMISSIESQIDNDTDEEPHRETEAEDKSDETDKPDSCENGKLRIDASFDSETSSQEAVTVEIEAEINPDLGALNGDCTEGNQENGETDLNEKIEDEDDDDNDVVVR